MIRNDIDKVIDRTKKFTTSRRGTLIQVKGIDELVCPSRPLNSFGLPDNMEPYLDSLMEGFMCYWNQRKHIEDDLLPALSPWYGIAEHSAFVGGHVDFSKNTSWHHQFINTYEDMGKLSLDENNIYLKLVIDGLKYIKEKADDRFFIRYRGADGPMDIANVVRGNDIFYDIYEEPEMLKELMDFCQKAVLFTLTRQKEIIDVVDGGVITGFGVWLEGNSIGHISEDASTMISPEQFSEFGKPYTEKVTSQFDHVFMHVHALGAHNLPLIASIDKIDNIEISNDPNCKRAIEIYKDFEEVLKDKTVIVNLTNQEVKENLEFLKNHKTIIWYDAATVKDAVETVSLVRTLGYE
ncbi:MAG: hypothetical protein JXQ23_04840 [Clostridia bacterium]|nr:hypothetical protein [Clostridia bacterium]